MSARAQREIASAEAAPCVSADGPLDARCSGGAGACAALCIGTLRCKSWNFRHPTTGWGSEISDQGRRALSMSRSSGRAPVRRSNSHGSSSRGSGGGGRGSSRSNGSGYNASFSGKPRSASGEAVTAHCQLFGFTMRGTAVAGLSAAAALGLGKGSRWSSGDIDRPAVSEWLLVFVLCVHLCITKPFGIHFIRTYHHGTDSNKERYYIRWARLRLRLKPSHSSLSRR